MQRLVLLLLLVSTCSSFALNWRLIAEETSNELEQLGTAAVYVIKKYISHRTRTLVVMEKCKLCDKSEQDFQHQLLDYVLWQQHATMAMQLYTGTPLDYPWNHYLFIVDSAEAFGELRSHFPATQHERDFYFLIILTAKNKHLNVLYRIVVGIFEICERFNVFHAIVMLPMQPDRIKFFTYRLFGRKCDKQLVPKLINTFANGTLANDYLYPEKIHGFYNCPVWVGAYHLPPYILISKDFRNGSELIVENSLTGIDGDVIKLLANILDFKLMISVSEDKGFIGRNGGAVGYFAMLKEGKIDVAIGGLSGSHPNRWVFSTSMIYYQSTLVFVLRTKHLYGQISLLFKPFRSFVWYSILLTITVASIVIGILHVFATADLRLFIMGPKNHHAACNLIKTFFGFSLASLPSTNFARFLLMSWLILTFVIRNAYQGKTYDVLRVPKTYQTPRNIDELLQQNYTLLASNYVDYYDESRTVLQEKNFVYRFESIAQLKNEKLTSVALIDNLAYYNWLHWNESQLTFVKEPIYNYQVTMFFRKHSVLRYAFNEKLKQLNTAGITTLIHKRYVKRKYQLMNAVPPTVKGINNEMLRGLYGLYGILIGLSFIVFLLELISKKFRSLQILLTPL